MTRFFIESSQIATRLMNRDGRHTLFDGRILDATGFLVPPSILNPLKSLPEIAEAGNAIIVAEGGMGKTFVLDNFANSLPSEEVKKINFAFYSNNPYRLEQDIESIADQKFLLVDGVNEAQELCPTLLQTLIRVKLSAHVIIASRSIPEIKAFCDNLKWPLFSLLPYTKDNVWELCEAEGKDFPKFLREVEGRGLGGACATPMGCKGLLSSFDGESIVCTSTEDLWHNTLMRLCSENDCSSTHDLKKDSAVTPANCWDIAVRTALVVKLAGKPIIERISSSSGLEKDAVDFSQLIPPEEHAKFNECLLRPLFSPIDHKQFLFANASHCDFMAAMGFVEHVNPTEWAKIVLLPEGVPFPQWEGAVPWLAARNTKLLAQIKNSRPDLLLGSEALAAILGKDEICQSIVENAENIPREIRNNPAIQAKYYELATDGCIWILEKTLGNSHSSAELDTAIDIVHRARLVQLGDSLVEVFCNPAKDENVRIHAGLVLREWANDNLTKKCRILLSEAMSNRLKGIALSLLWPKHMATAELIPLLEPNADGVFDSYDWWLNHEFPLSFGQLPEAELGTLLKWTIANLRYPGNAEEHHFLGLKLGIFRHCWKKMSSRPMRDLLAEGLETCAKIPLDPFGDHWLHGQNIYGWHEFIADVTLRRDMARLIVEDESRALAPLTHPYIGLLQYGDIDFILSEIKASDRGTCRERWAQGLWPLSGAIDLPKQSDLWNWLHSEFPRVFKMDAKRAQEERKAFDAQMQGLGQSRQRKEADRKLKQAEIREKQTGWIREQLRKEDGTCPFDKVMFLILCQPQDDATSFCHDFRQSQLWPTFSQQEIKVLTDAAYNFILSCNGPWSDENGWYPSYPQAFCLLMACDKERLNDLPPDVWRKFLPELWRDLGYETSDLLAATWKCLLEHHPDVFVSELEKRFGDQLAKNQVPETYVFKDIVNAKATKRLLAALDNERLTDEQRRKLYDGFWQIDARTTAEHINSSWIAQMPIDKCGVQTSLYLILSAPQKQFPRLLQLLGKKPRWGREWAKQILGEDGYHHCPLSGILCHLPVSDLKKFYAWLLVNFPPENDLRFMRLKTREPMDDADEAKSRQMDNVYDSISDVFRAMTSRVDPELPQALEDLSKKFPRLKYFQNAILQAKRNLLERGCLPLDLRSIKRLLETNNHATIVNSPDDLLSIVCETLAKYQIYLTGKDTPLVGLLWNIAPQYVSHKDEESFSDHIKGYLDMVLPNIVVNREVQLSRKKGDQPGSRTDIWVTAISKATNTRLRLCIEVKGSWNRTCRTAFKDQLCEQYMGDGGADAGIFLVGWFFSKKAKKNCNQWKDMDSARRFLQEQETDCRKRGFKVRSIVVDCTY